MEDKNVKKMKAEDVHCALCQGPHKIAEDEPIEEIGGVIRVTAAGQGTAGAERKSKTPTGKRYETTAPRICRCGRPVY